MQLNNFSRVKIPTLIPEIDDECGGLDSGKIHIISGKAKSGKSRLAQKIAVCVNSQNIPTIYINSEDDYDYYREYMVECVPVNAHEININLISNSLTDKELEDLFVDNVNTLIVVDDERITKQFLIDTSFFKHLALKNNITVVATLQRSPREDPKHTAAILHMFRTIIL